MLAVLARRRLPGLTSSCLPTGPGLAAVCLASRARLSAACVTRAAGLPSGAWSSRCTSGTSARLRDGRTHGHQRQRKCC